MMQKETNTKKSLYPDLNEFSIIARLESSKGKDYQEYSKTNDIIKKMPMNLLESNSERRNSNKGELNEAFLKHREPNNDFMTSDEDDDAKRIGFKTTNDGNKNLIVAKIQPLSNIPIKWEENLQGDHRSRDGYSGENTRYTSRQNVSPDRFKTSSESYGQFYNNGFSSPKYASFSAVAAEDLNQNRTHGSPSSNQNFNLSTELPEKRSVSHGQQNVSMISQFQRQLDQPLDRSFINPIYTSISPALIFKIDSRPNEFQALFFIERGSLGLSPLKKYRAADPFEVNWKWNDVNYIRVPISPEYKKWEMITEQLTKLKEMCSTGKWKEKPEKVGESIKNAISSYAGEGYSDFAILEEKHIAPHVLATLPCIIDHALKLPQLLSRPIPKLKQGENKTIFVTKQLCCSLLANAFFCTYPKQQPNMPDFNFFRFLHSTNPEKIKVKMEKLMCILNYFHQMSSKVLDKNKCPEIIHNIVSFERRNKKLPGNIAFSRKPLINVIVQPTKNIEQMEGMLQVDFANKLIGGGVLGNGAVQEEVRFSICPELIVSRLFTEMMNDDEAVFITGTQQFAEYSGYGSGFQFVKPIFQKILKRDGLSRMKTEVVAMDAVRFKQHEKSNQFKESCINRELLKCYVAFSQGSENCPVATGNWGCGAFNGDTELKFLIQLVAASENQRPSMHYHTFGDEDQSKAIMEMMKILDNQKVTTGLLYKAILKYDQNKNEYDSVFDFVRDEVSPRARSSSQSQAYHKTTLREYNNFGIQRR